MAKISLANLKSITMILKAVTLTLISILLLSCSEKNINKINF